VDTSLTLGACAVAILRWSVQGTADQGAGCDFRNAGGLLEAQTSWATRSKPHTTRFKRLNARLAREGLQRGGIEAGLLGESLFGPNAAPPSHRLRAFELCEGQKEGQEAVRMRANIWE
jgi:hypothetical protein